MKEQAANLLAHASVVQAPYELTPVCERLEDVVVLPEPHFTEHLVDGGQPVQVEGTKGLISPEPHFSSIS